MIDIVKVPLSDDRTINTRSAPSVILNQMRHVWGNETDKPMDNYTVYEWDTWKTMESSNKVIFLGGDHSIPLSTFPKTKASRLVVFDSHFDLYGSIDKPFHGNWLKVLIERNIVKPCNITVLGVRAWDKTELAYAREKGIEYVLFDCPSSVKISDEPTYLSIDIDVIDPAYAPGTVYMEPGGWSSRNLLDIVKTFCNNNIIAMDIVEVDPTREFNDMTSKLAAKVIKEFL